MILEAKVVIAPSNRMGFVFGRTGSDYHWEAVYLGGGNWRIVTLNDMDNVPAVTKASAQGWDLVGGTTYWFKVTISASGLIKFYCNNTLMVQYNNGAAIPEGNVGLRCWMAAGSTFDKFKIAQTVPTDDPSFTGADIGDMTIVERRPVKSVEVIGSACNLPAWLEVNGERHDWKFSHSHDSGDTGQDGIQTLVFTISPPDTYHSI